MKNERLAQLRAQFNRPKRDDNDGRGAYFKAYGCRRAAWLERPESCFRFAGYADELSRMVEYRGWYVDNDGLGETARGCVYRLTHGRFIAAVADPYNDGPAVVDFDRVYDDETEAAYAADETARLMAEEYRDENECAGWEMRLEDIAEQLRDVRGAVLAILRERKAAPIGNYPALRDAVCARIRSLLGERSRLFAEQAELRENLQWAS